MRRPHVAEIPPAAHGVAPSSARADSSRTRIPQPTPQQSHRSCDSHHFTRNDSADVLADERGGERIVATEPSVELGDARLRAVVAGGHERGDLGGGVRATHGGVTTVQRGRECRRHRVARCRAADDPPGGRTGARLVRERAARHDMPPGPARSRAALCPVDHG